MMRYLQRQRKLIRSEAGFNRCVCLLLCMFILLSVLIPGESMQGKRLPDAEREEWQLGATGAGAEKVAVIFAPVQQKAEVQSAGRELGIIRTVETLEQRMAFRYRNLWQIRLLVWCLLAEGFVAHALFAVFLVGGRKRQWELVPRSRMIVAYICRADGKKNGLASSIK